MKLTSLRPLFLVLVSFFVLTAAQLGAADAQPTLPRLVDLGAGTFIPCKQMQPILDDLTRNYADQFTVVFIDVWENRAEGAKYGIRMIPTQIFFSADGKELARHEGFMAKKDILAKWKELGVEVKESVTPTAN